MDFTHAPGHASRKPHTPPVHPAREGEESQQGPDEARLLRLQRAAGNAAVARMVEAGGTVQRQPEAGTPGTGAGGRAQRPDLRLGAAGPAVAELQRAMVRLGYPIGVDGSFGNRTAAFVCLMQHDAGVTVDGVVGHVVWDLVDTINSGEADMDVEAVRPEEAAALAGGAVRSSTSAESPAGPSRPAQRQEDDDEPPVVSVEDLPKANPRTLQRGDTGPDVTALQQQLASLNPGAGVTVNGTFGAETTAFVLLLQVGGGLAPDGVVGPATRKVLDALAGATRKLAAADELKSFAADLAAMPPEARERLTALPSGIARDLEELRREE